MRGDEDEAPEDIIPGGLHEEPVAPRRGSPHRGARPWAVVVRSAILLVAVAVVAATGFTYAVKSSVEAKVSVLPADLLDGLATRPAAGTAPITLLLGTDRGLADSPGDTPGEKADSIMLIRQAPSSAHAEVLSLPRDAVVDVQDKGKQKLNSTLAGGIPLVVQTVESLTGLHVDHILVVDFSGLSRITTALGGVTIDNPETVTDPQTKRTFQKGPIVLEGAAAVTWVRQRPVARADDSDRILNQQRMLAAVGAKIKEVIAGGNPARIKDVLDTIADNLTIDASLTVDSLTALVRELVATPQDKVSFYTAPVQSATTTAAGVDQVTLDLNALKAAATAIGNDQAPSLTKTPVFGG